MAPYQWISPTILIHTFFFLFWNCVFVFLFYCVQFWRNKNPFLLQLAFIYRQILAMSPVPVKSTLWLQHFVFMMHSFRDLKFCKVHRGYVVAACIPWFFPFCPNVYYCIYVTYSYISRSISVLTVCCRTRTPSSVWFWSSRAFTVWLVTTRPREFLLLTGNSEFVFFPQSFCLKFS